MRKLLTVLFLFCCMSDMSIASPFGGYDAGAMNSQYMQDLRTHEAFTRARAKNDAIISTKTTPKPEQQISSAPLKSIVFINNNSIPSETLINVVQSSFNEPMNAVNIAKIRKDIMKYYQENGFYSALVMVNSENPQTGELVLEIKEGGKNSIQIQD